MDLSHVTWLKSSHSTQNGSCVEIAVLEHASRPLIAVRDSKDPGGPKLAFTGPEWKRFLAEVRDGSPSTG
jgi:hypothetical protein